MYGLSNIEFAKLNDVFVQIPEIEQVILFGSRARGNNKPYSDVDISLKGSKLKFDHLAILEDKIDYLLLPYFFDINIFANLNNEKLIENIIRDGKLIYQKI